MRRITSIMLIILMLISLSSCSTSEKTDQSMSRTSSTELLFERLLEEEPELYYDCFLDLTQYMEDERIESTFEDNVGIPLREYKAVRLYFDIQSKYKGFDDYDYLEMLINDTDNDICSYELSQETTDVLQSMIDEQDITLYSSPEYYEVYNEIGNYRDTFISEHPDIRDFCSSYDYVTRLMYEGLRSYYSSDNRVEYYGLTTVYNATDTDVEGGYSDKIYNDELEKIKRYYDRYDELSDYVSENTSYEDLNDFLLAIRNGEIEDDDEILVYVLSRLLSNGNYLKRTNMDEFYDAVIVPERISYMGTLDMWEEYHKDIDLTYGDRDVVCTDMETLYGLLYGETEDEMSEAIDTIRNTAHIDMNLCHLYYALLGLRDYRAGIEYINQTVEMYSNDDNVCLPDNIYDYLSPTGGFDPDLYRAYRQNTFILGGSSSLDEYFTMDFYNRINNTYMDNTVTIYQWELEHEITPVEEAQAAYDQAVASGADESTINRYYLALQESIVCTQRAEDKINNPPSIFDQADLDRLVSSYEQPNYIWVIYNNVIG